MEFNELNEEMYEDRNIIISNLDNKYLRIGDIAPLFSANSTQGNIKLSDYNGKWLILFSHPGDFTPVCTTEFIVFENMKHEFDKRNCSLLGISIDSNPSHLAWIHNIHKNTGTKISFPVIADTDMKIAKMYGMIAPNESSTKTVRSVFFIDPNQKIRAILQYPMSSGRNIIEIIRLLDSLQIHDKEGVMTQANWIQGQPCLLPPPQTYEELDKKANELKNSNCIDWYLCFNNNLNSLPMYDQLPFNDNLQVQTINTKDYSNLINKYMYQ